MSNVKGESTGDDEFESSCRTTKERRKWMSCRASSLLDEQEEEEEEGGLRKEPGLMCLSDEESDESCEEKKEGKRCYSAPDAKADIVTLVENRDDDNALVQDIITDSEAAMESIAQLTEGVASYLCPATFETISKEKYASHGRKGSDTDFFQQHMSSGTCGTATCFGQKVGIINFNSSTSTRAMEELSHQPVLQNRCAVRAAQTRRVQELWNNWHSTPGESPEDANETTRQRRSVPSNTNQRNLAPKVWSIGATKSLGCELELHTNNVSSMISPISHDTFAFSDVMLATHNESPSLLDFEAVSDLYYDSDPECFVNTRISNNQKSELQPSRPPLLLSRSRSEPTVKRSRRRFVPPPIDTTMSATSDIVPPLTPKNSGADKKTISQSPMDIERFDLNDDELVLNFIKELTVGTVTLVWHPSPDESNKASGSPVSVQGWFEMGSLLSRKLIQPKFMWRSTYQPDLVRKKLSMSSRTPDSVELLSIVKILKPESIDRTIYPFVKIDQSFTLSCHSNKTYVFEASSSKERDRFVHGLKLVVARLASMIIVGDDDVFKEFFSPWGHSTPGNEASNNQATEEERNRAANKCSGETVMGSNLLSTTNKQRGELWGTAFFR